MAEGCDKHASDVPDHDACGSCVYVVALACMIVETLAYVHQLQLRVFDVMSGGQGCSLRPYTCAWLEYKILSSCC